MNKKFRDRFFVSFMIDPCSSYMVLMNSGQALVVQNKHGQNEPEHPRIAEEPVLFWPLMLRLIRCSAVVPYASATLRVMPMSESFSVGISTRSALSSCFHFNSPLYQAVPLCEPCREPADWPDECIHNDSFIRPAHHEGIESAVFRSEANVLGSQIFLLVFVEIPRLNFNCSGWPFP